MKSVYVSCVDSVRVGMQGKSKYHYDSKVYKKGNYMEIDMHWANAAIVLKLYFPYLTLKIVRNSKNSILIQF